MKTKIISFSAVYYEITEMHSGSPWMFDFNRTNVKSVISSQ